MATFVIFTDGETQFYVFSEDTPVVVESLSTQRELLITTQPLKPVLDRNPLVSIGALSMITFLSLWLESVNALAAIIDVSLLLTSLHLVCYGFYFNDLHFVNYSPVYTHPIRISPTRIQSGSRSVYTRAKSQVFLMS